MPFRFHILYGCATENCAGLPAQTLGCLPRTARYSDENFMLYYTLSIACRLCFHSLQRSRRPAIPVDHGLMTMHMRAAFQLRFRSILWVKGGGGNIRFITNFCSYLVHNIGRVVALRQHGVREVRVIVEVELQREPQQVFLVHATHVRQVEQRL